MSNGELKLRDGEEDLILDIAVRSVLRYGSKCPEPLSVLLPMWKDTPMYRRGIFLQRLVFVEYAPSWKVKKALQSLDPDPWFRGEYDVDFFHGLFDSSSKMYLNGTYKRAEFGGRKHLRNFLENEDHGQTISFAEMNEKRKRLNRTAVLPFMEIPAKNDLERWFVGVMCGSDVHMVDGEPMMKIRTVCVPNMKRLGISFVGDGSGKNVLVSCFYIMLFMSDIPDFFLHHWMSLIPHRGLGSMPMATTDAMMHWKIMKKGRMVRGAFPFLLDAKESNRSGIRISEVMKKMTEINFNFVDQRITKRCERWENLSMIDASEQKGETA